jgi:hypothetical protein
MGYYKHLIGSARAIISELRLDESYKRAVLGMIARTIDGKVIHRDEFLGRLSSLRSRDRSAGAEGESLRSLLLAQAAALPPEESLRPLQGRDGRADRRAMLAVLLEGPLPHAPPRHGEGSSPTLTPIPSPLRGRGEQRGEGAWEGGWGVRSGAGG